MTQVINYIFLYISWHKFTLIIKNNQEVEIFHIQGLKCSFHHMKKQDNDCISKTPI